MLNEGHSPEYQPTQGNAGVPSKKTFDEVFLDDDCNSIYGSDVDSLPAYDPDGEDELVTTMTVLTVSSRPKGDSTTVPRNQSQRSLCIVCEERPRYSQGKKQYPTCGLSCAGKLKTAGNSIPGSPMSSGRGLVPSKLGSPVQQSRQGATPTYASSTPFPGRASSMCVVCGVKPSYINGAKKYPTCGLTCAAKLKSGPRLLCVVCGIRPSYDDGKKRFPTCGLTCATNLASGSSSRAEGPHVGIGSSTSGLGVGRPQLICIICNVRPSHSDGSKKYPTCGSTCARTLATGGAPPGMCDYCHRVPKSQQYDQCGPSCRQAAQMACLLCRSRPKNGKYHFCGRLCKSIAMEMLPLLLEIRPGHTTFEMVETKFKQAWHMGRLPQVKSVYKIVESQAFLRPYDAYRTRYRNECFRYHGTRRECRLGDPGNTRICNSNTCPVCSILRTSYNVSLANPGGAFGQGIYTSSASNKSASYSPNGVMFLNKVVLGKVHTVQAFAAVTSCPLGYQSVVFDRQNGQLNETIVYRNDAIRPVFLIVFG